MASKEVKKLKRLLMLDLLTRFEFQISPVIEKYRLPPIQIFDKNCPLKRVNQKFAIFRQNVRKFRPLSAPFLFRTSGKGTDMAILELKHAKEQVELVRIFLRSLLRPQESLF